jgi:hypothetical protein
MHIGETAPSFPLVPWPLSWMHSIYQLNGLEMPVPLNADFDEEYDPRNKSGEMGSEMPEGGGDE